MLGELADGSVGWQAFSDAFAQTHYGLEPSAALRTLAAIQLCACTLAFSLRATWLILPGLGVPMRWGTTFAVGMWTSTVGFHVLRSLGAFTLPGALVASTLLLAGTLCAAPERLSLRRIGRLEWRAVCRLARLARRSRFKLINGLFAAAACLFALRALIIPPLGWDTMTYHGPRAALWLQTGQLTFDPGPSVYMFYRHFFAGGEVLSAWAMLPFHSDLLANLATIVQWLGLGVATWALARELGCREPYASTSAAVTMFSPIVLGELNSGYVDIVLSAALLQGIALGVWCVRRFRAPAALVAMMAIGVAAGIKLTAIAPAVIVAIPLALRLLSEPALRPKHRLALLSAAGVCALLPAAPWIYLAWSETGHPFSPMPVELAGFRLGASNPAIDWYNTRPELQPYEWSTEGAALLGLFAPPHELSASTYAFTARLGPLSVLPLLAFPLGLIVLVRRDRLIAVILAAAMFAPVFMHFSPAMNTTRLLWGQSCARFLIAPLALAIVIGALIGRSRHPVLASAYRYLVLVYPLHAVILGLRWGWGPWEPLELLIVGSLIALGGVAVRHCSTLRRKLAVGIVLLAAGCSALQVRRDETREGAFTTSFALHPIGGYWSPLTRYIDRKPRRIAITAGPDQDSDHWFGYFLLGPRLSNRVIYVPPTRDGSVADIGPLGDLASRASEVGWRARLLAQNIGAVMTFAPRSLEQTWMDAHPEHYRRVAGQSTWGLYRVVR